VLVTPSAECGPGNQGGGRTTRERSVSDPWIISNSLSRAILSVDLVSLNLASGRALLRDNEVKTAPFSADFVEAFWPSRIRTATLLRLLPLCKQPVQVLGSALSERPRCCHR
jgi:hypothetical protein